MPAACSASSSSAIMSAAVTSTLVTGSAATTSQRTGVGELATASRTRSWNNSALAKKSGASQRNSTRPGISRASRIPRDVVIALDVIDAAEHRRVRTPAVPEELDHGNDDRERDARNGAEHGHAREADHRQPELPALDAIDAAQVGDFEQADRRRDDDGGQRGVRQMLEQRGREQQQQRDGERADHARQLGLRARRLGDRRARRAAADREALEETGRQVGDAEADHLLVRIDRCAQTRRIGSRQHARVRE